MAYFSASLVSVGGMAQAIRAAALVIAVLPMAAAAQNPEGFNTPDGYSVYRPVNESFGLFTDTNAYDCPDGKSWRKCGPGDHPLFEESGRPRMEGRIERVVYRADGNGQSGGYLLQRNYERVIGQMGGKLIARMRGHSERRGMMRHLYALDRPGERKVVLVDTWSSTSSPALVVVTQTALPEILTAGELKSQIDAQGFVTLNVNIDTNSSEVRDADKPALDEVVRLLSETPSLRLSVDGHTDNVGDAAFNKKLSQARSQAIVRYLTDQGVDAKRLKAQGFGMEAPVADNRTEAGRAKNRRVELVKLK